MTEINKSSKTGVSDEQIAATLRMEAEQAFQTAGYGSAMWNEGMALLGRKMLAGAEAIERLQKNLHDAGAAFTGGNVSCATCRRIYNSLASSQGWSKFPERPGDETFDCSCPKHPQRDEPLYNSTGRVIDPKCPVHSTGASK